MQEARIILPYPVNHKVHDWLQATLVDAFGGFTAFAGFSGRHNGRSVITEQVTIYDVVADNRNLNTNATLRAIAKEARKRSHEKAIYLRLPNGNVEFINGEELEKAV